MQAKRERRFSLSPEERLHRAISSRRKFKAIVHLIIANLAWLQELEDDRLGDNVKKNIQVLMRKKAGAKGLLTLKDRAVLNKDADLRTDEEKAHLKRIIGNLKCFRRYPAEVKNELPLVMYFVYYGPNRVIVKQDYPPWNMYVILSGEVVVTQTYYDRLLKEHVTKEVGIMEAGSYFGEVSLLHGINRTATCTTLTECEFLYIKKEDFDRVLKSTVLELWAEVQLNMSYFTYFKGWSETDIRESCILAKKRFYQPDEIILGAMTGLTDHVYFVIKGSCFMLEHMLIKKCWKKGYVHYSLVKERLERAESKPSFSTVKEIEKLADVDSEDPEKIRRSLRPSIPVQLPSPSHHERSTTKMHFIKICTFSRLACFNVGENMKNRVIVADTEAECLLLPRYFLYEKSMTTFGNVARYLSFHIPSTEKIFGQFVEEIHWKEYKEKMVKDLLANKRAGNDNSIHNVPYTIRLAEDLGEI